MGILKGLVITAAGAVGPGKGNEQLKKWVEANSGRWVPRVTKGVTHLITSKEMYKKNAEPVKQAKELGAFIVSYDWLEDSLQGRRRLKERKYTWEVLRSTRKTRKTMKRLGPKHDTEKFLKGCKRAQEDTGSGTSAPRKRSSSTFFRPALDDLKRKREEREAKEADEKAKKAVKASVPEIASKVTEHNLAEPAKESVDAGQPSSFPAASKSTSHAVPKPQCKPKPQPTPSEGILSQPNATKPTPVPSAFPPCLKYTPPVSTPSSSESVQVPSPNTNIPPQPMPEKPKPNAKLTDLYHTYFDVTGFNYDLLFLRSNPFLNTFAKYDLRLYESNTKPHVYCTFIRYTPPGTRSSSASNIPITPGDMRKKSSTSNQAAVTARPNPSTQEDTTKGTAADIEKARLRSLVEKPLPSPESSHRELLAPMNSPFPTAMLAFRHAFRDLTLLTWEERIDTDPKSSPHSTQRLRARAFNIEPFIWRKPDTGLPVGYMPTIPLGVEDKTYVRNRWNLPGLDVALGTEGGIGSALVREAEVARKKEEEERVRREVEEKRRSRSIGKEGKRPNFNKPLFNGATGRPVTDAYGRYFKYGEASAPSSPSESAMASGSRSGIAQSSRPAAGIGAARGNGGNGAGTGTGTGGGGSGTGRAIFTEFPTKRSQRWAKSAYFGFER